VGGFAPVWNKIAFLTAILLAFHYFVEKSDFAPLFSKVDFKKAI